MGDVVSIGTKQVVQVGDDRPPLGSLSEPEGDDLVMDAAQIGEFIGLANALDLDSDRESQLRTMAQIRQVVQLWPDG
jgi:hypothetical protein